MSALLAATWAYIAAAAGVVLVMVMAWFTGKSKGATEAKARADVETATKETQQSHIIVEKQQETVKVVKNVDQTNQSLSDTAARDKLRNSKYHSAD